MEKKFSRPINDKFYEPEDVEKIGNHFDKFMNRHPCPVCGNKKWGLSKELMTGTVFHLGQDRHWHSKVDLQIKAGCQNCGYIIYFDAGKAGISPRQATEITVEVEDDSAS